LRKDLLRLLLKPTDACFILTII